MRFYKLLILSGIFLHVFSLHAQKNVRTLKTEKVYIYEKIQEGPLKLAKYTCDSFSVKGRLQMSVSFEDRYRAFFDTVQIYNSPGEQRIFSLNWEDDDHYDTVVRIKRFDDEGRVIFEGYNFPGIPWAKYTFDRKGTLIMKEENGGTGGFSSRKYYFSWGDSICVYFENNIYGCDVRKVYTDKIVRFQTTYKDNKVQRSSRYISDSLVTRKAGKMKMREYYGTDPYDVNSVYLSRQELLDQRDSLISEVQYYPKNQVSYERKVVRNANGKKIYQVQNRMGALDSTFYISAQLEVNRHIDKEGNRSVDSLFYIKKGVTRQVYYLNDVAEETVITQTKLKYTETFTNYEDGEITYREIFVRDYY